jgi:hypothetical protein
MNADLTSISLICKIKVSLVTVVFKRTLSSAEVAPTVTVTVPLARPAAGALEVLRVSLSIVNQAMTPIPQPSTVLRRALR